MRVARLFATVAVATVAGLAFASPALADGTTVPIHSSHVPTTAADFEKKECTGPFADLADNKDGWHFITTGTASFTSVTLKFDTPGGDVTLTITGTEAAPSSGTGWEGWLDNAGSAEKHAYLITDAGWELLEGSAVVTGVDEQNQFFNLSHTCAGTPDNPSESPSPSPSRSNPGTPSPDPSVSTSPSDGGGSLPRTGTATGAIVIGGIALVGGGVALLAIRRRRDMVGS